MFINVLVESLCLHHTSERLTPQTSPLGWSNTLNQLIPSMRTTVKQHVGHVDVSMRCSVTLEFLSSVNTAQFLGKHPCTTTQRPHLQFVVVDIGSIAIFIGLEVEVIPFRAHKHNFSTLTHTLQQPMGAA